MARFDQNVARTIALVKERKTIPLDELIGELGFSPNYVRDICKAAVNRSKDPELVIESLWHPENFTRDKPALWVKKEYEAALAKVRGEDASKATPRVPDPKPETLSQPREEPPTRPIRWS